MGTGYIPVSKIWDYADRLGLVENEYDRFETIIRMMDDAYVSGSKPASKPDKGPFMKDEVAVNDRAGVLKVLRRLAKPSQKPQPQRKPSGRSR